MDDAPIYFGPDVIQAAINLNGLSESIMGWGDGNSDTIIVNPGVYAGFELHKADLTVLIQPGAVIAPFNAYTSIVVSGAGSSVQGCSSCSVCYDMDRDEHYADDYLEGGACLALDRADCDDDNATIYSSVSGYTDLDGDGYGDQNDVEPETFCTSGNLPELYSINNNDCNDNRSDITIPRPYYKDADKDGFGTSDVSLIICEPPQDYVDLKWDCDDAEPDVNPLAEDLCDAIDNDCDGDPDEGCFTDGNKAYVNTTGATTAEYGSVETAITGLTNEVGSENIKIMRLKGGSYNGMIIDTPNIIVEAAYGEFPLINGGAVGPGSNSAVQVSAADVSLLGLSIDMTSGAYETGFWVDDYDRVSINYNSFLGGSAASETSAASGVMSSGMTDVDARNCWWDGASGPSGDYIDACDNETYAVGEGLQVSDLVCFKPHLLKPFAGSVEKQFLEHGPGIYFNGALLVRLISDVTVTAAVSAALFDGLPTAENAFSENDKYFDLYIPDVSDNITEIEVTRCDVSITEDTQLKFNQGFSWQAVTPSGTVSDGCITFHLDRESEPPLNRLKGLLFSIGNDPSSGGDNPGESTTTTVTSGSNGGGGGGGSGGGGGGSGTATTTAPEASCYDDSECDDGLFCNGQETCIAGECSAGVFPCEDYESCDEDLFVCVPPPLAPDCLTDSDCDNGLYCDGEEICIDGSCADTAPACSGDQECSEGLQLCLDVSRLAARPVQRFIVRPRLKQVRCTALMLRLSDDDQLFSGEDSQVLLSGPDNQSTGLIYNDGRKMRRVGRIISVPVCIEKDISPGLWSISLKTQSKDTDSPWVELISADFLVK